MDLIVWEAANLFAGDDDPLSSKHLSLMNVKLPSLEEMYQDHHPGGSLVQVEVEVGIKKLETTFKLAGIDPDLLVKFGLNSKIKQRFTIRQVLRSKRTGNPMEGKAIIEGRLSKVTPDEFKRGDLAGNDYGINSIMHYELIIGGKEKLYWDFFTSTLRVDGDAVNATENSMLGIPQTI